jgi:hypothetical protein
MADGATADLPLLLFGAASVSQRARVAADEYKFFYVSLNPRGTNIENSSVDQVSHRSRPLQSCP